MNTPANTYQQKVNFEAEELSFVLSLLNQICELKLNENQRIPHKTKLLISVEMVIENNEEIPIEDVLQSRVNALKNELQKKGYVQTITDPKCKLYKRGDTINYFIDCISDLYTFQRTNMNVILNSSKNKGNQLLSENSMSSDEIYEYDKIISIYSIQSQKRHYANVISKVGAEIHNYLMDKLNKKDYFIGMRELYNKYILPLETEATQGK